MSKVDLAWLRMECPTNLMMISGVMVFEGAMDYEALKRTYRSRFLSFKRFMQRPVERAGSWYWETDPNFDIEVHIHRTALPGKADQAELQELASQLASTPLDKNKPMWEVHLVENYGGNTAVILRIHHCYADGIALIQVFLSMTDTSPEAQAARRPKRARRLSRDEGSVLERLYRPAGRKLEAMLQMGSRVWDEGTRIVSDPERAKAYLADGQEIAVELVTALALSNDPPSLFKGRMGVRKRVAWCAPIPLAEVKAVAKAMDCKVNDVLVAAVTGALREYLVEQGESPDGLEIRATVPVNLRPLEHTKELGNHFGLVFLTLPLGVANPMERLYRIKNSMEKLKASKQAIMTFGALAAVGLAPSRVQRQALDALSRKATAVLTNVPGPQQDLYLAGSRLLEQMFWVPQNGTIGMGISILSYNGQVQFGIMTDMKLVPNPDAIIGRFAGEFEKLLLTTLMEPWDEERTPAEVEASIGAYLARLGHDPTPAPQ
jgi:WS/DGAT/MGAT family acyltransferase